MKIFNDSDQREYDQKCDKTEELGSIVTQSREPVENRTEKIDWLNLLHLSKRCLQQNVDGTDMKFILDHLPIRSEEEKENKCSKVLSNCQLTKTTSQIDTSKNRVKKKQKKRKKDEKRVKRRNKKMSEHEKQAIQESDNIKNIDQVYMEVSTRCNVALFFLRTCHWTQ
ncbi:hypothetical protein RFI_07608, partial [Reticulomyxa filosa]